jgi:oxygen-dependent protoporphyrinogen oxidase
VRGLRAASRRKREGLPGPTVPSTALLSFPRGLSEIVDALAASLGSRVRTKSALASVERRAGAWVARTAAGESMEADRIVLAVGAPIAAKILGPLADGQIPIEHLTGIRHASVTLVHIGFDASEVPDLPPGFGYLVPPRSDDGLAADAPTEPRALGTIFASNLFPGRAPAGCVAISSFYRSNEVQGLEEKGLIELACEDLSRAIRQEHSPHARTAVVQRWTDVIPRYAPGHADRISELARAVSDRLPGLHLSGNYVAGVSVDQVITRGRATAEEILRERRLK